jgi:hypothetical protein
VLVFILTSVTAFSARLLCMPAFPCCRANVPSIPGPAHVYFAGTQQPHHKANARRIENARFSTFFMRPPHADQQHLWEQRMPLLVRMNNHVAMVFGRTITQHVTMCLFAVGLQGLAQTYHP